MTRFSKGSNGLILILGAPLLGLACQAPTQSKTVSASTSVATQYLFRGVPRVDALVSQSDLVASVDLEDNASAGIEIWANIDLSNDTGDAIFPDGNGGNLTEVDFVPSYTIAMGQTEVGLGLTSFSFPSNVGESTTEAFASFTRPLGVYGGNLTVNYDFDQVEDFYITAALDRSYAMDKGTSITAQAQIGWAGKDQGLTYWGVNDSGLSDASIGLSFSHQTSGALAVSGGIMTSTILKSSYEDALDLLGIDTDNLVFWLGLSL